MMRLITFFLRLLQSRFAHGLFQNLALTERLDLLIRMEQILVRGLSPQEKYLLLRGLYAPFEMDRFSLQNSNHYQKIYGFFCIVNEIEKVSGDIVEAGVGHGRSLAAIVYGVSYFRMNKTVYGFDSFLGFPLSTTEDVGVRVTNTGQQVRGWQDTSSDLVYRIFQQDRLVPDKSLLANFDVDIRLFPGFFAETIPANLPDRIALLHVDCDLYDSYKHVLESTILRMSPGGIILLDEYASKKWPGAKKAVDEFCIKNKLQVSFYSPLRRHIIRIP